MESGTAGVMLKALELAQAQLDNYKQVTKSWAAQERNVSSAKKASSDQHKSQRGKSA